MAVSGDRSTMVARNRIPDQSSPARASCSHPTSPLGCDLRLGGIDPATSTSVGGTLLDPMFLSEVEQHDDPGSRGQIIRRIKAAGAPVPQIMHLFAYKADRTKHLEYFTQGVMRGPSPLPPGQRELIAAFTSRRNECPF